MEGKEIFSVLASYLLLPKPNFIIRALHVRNFGRTLSTLTNLAHVAFLP